MSAPTAPAFLRVAVAGARGFIGSALLAALRADGHTVLTIGRGGKVDVRWDPASGGLDPAALRGVDAVVNLAGERIDQRWTGHAKARILESRVRSTGLLARTMAGLRPRPLVLVSMSAIGVYGDRGDDPVDETSPAGGGFLAEVVQAWEGAADPARDAGIRVIHPRTGVVLHPDGGALARMLPVFRLGAGGRIGDGRQWMSWISRTDAVRAIAWLLRQRDLAGAVNVVAPEPVRNAEFTRTLARAIHRPAIAIVPALVIKAMFGRMGEETLLAGQRVEPRRLLDAGFVFSYPTLERAFAHELRAD